MLTESFVASVLSGDKSASNAAAKDVGIHLHDYQPIAGLKASFKRSSTPVNCLAVSASHIFAAQSEKAVVHVYNRERGNQEAIVPFPERIHSVTFAGDPNGAGVLLLGTEGGRVNLWELCTGRQISTPQSHLQTITCLAADSTANFLLSGSLDSNIHVWSLPTLLSFASSSVNDISQPSLHAPLRSLANHRAAITALTVGHSASNTNIAVSASKDNTCIVWDYHTGAALHTFLLPSTPLCLTLDPADRAVYAGYDDGSIQLVDFYKNASLTQALHDPALQSTPTQALPSDRWALPSAATSAALCLDVSYDGTSILSGHQNGKVQIWDIAKGRYNIQLADFSAPHG
ncbi:WD40/YVTN repeat-like-containing domain [Lasallia pustulata]|uniref:Pre-rRNA-processing protein IPI3 n=1 Tax=Lasallia pustulata TaxID=136370 RepID=A0A1W5CVN3_9LECA|nr:WD40/YVTN repeat-like-containing domain [Lasallia pustulata]